jgi:hypothetical protein
MTDHKSGFISKIQKLNPNIKAVHCIIHRQALASKKLSPDLNKVMEITFKTLNFIKVRALNSRLFKVLCDEMVLNTTIYFYIQKLDSSQRVKF